MTPSATIHATTVSLNGMGVLLRGAPGSGKSSLALQLIDQTGNGLGPFALSGRLVADDQTVLTLQDGRLMASPPPSLKGLLEVRGLGLVTVDAEPSAPVVLVVDLTPTALIERIPDPKDLCTTILGIELPRMDIDARHPSAAARVRAAILAVTKGAFPP